MIKNIVLNRLAKIYSQFHQGIRQDREFAKVHSEAVSCREGCAGCCRQWIGVFSVEAQAAVFEATRVGYDIPLKSVEEQASRVYDIGSDLDKAAWYGTPCVFLRPDNRCAIYRFRPLVCRSVFVISDPKNCHTATGRVMKVTPVQQIHRAACEIRELLFRHNLDSRILAFPGHLHPLVCGRPSRGIPIAEFRRRQQQPRQLG